jgi:hypothetical protein
VNDCEQLCAYLSPYGWYAVAACDAVCLGFGIDEFINLIVNEDIDPIWYAMRHLLFFAFRFNLFQCVCSGSDSQVL